MSFDYPPLLGIAALVTAMAVAGYVAVQKRRAAALTASGFAPDRSRRAAIRRHLPYALLLAAVPILITGLARPAAELNVPRVAGTVLLAFDVSNSMKATDVAPSRPPWARPPSPPAGRPRAAAG